MSPARSLRSTLGSIALFASLSAAASAAAPAPPIDVLGFDVDGIKIGMSPDQVRPLVGALLGQNAVRNRAPFETPVDCRTGKTLGPPATQQRNVARRDRCVGKIQAAFGTSKIAVTFGPTNADYGNAAVTSVELLDVVPIDGNDRAIPNAYLKQAQAKFGKPTISLSYDRDNRAYLIYCSDGTIASACRQAPQRHVSDLIDAKPEAVSATGPPANAYVLVSAGASVGDTWSLSASLVDLRSFKAAPKPL